MTGSCSYEIVIATRNRAAALGMSLPRMLDQSELPERIVIVDSSDDPLAVEHAVEQIPGRNSAVPISVIRSEPGLPRQRNVGLARVQAPIVLFPDDDALWFQGYAASILRVYRADAESAIAGVCGKPQTAPPPHIGSEPAYEVSRESRVRTRTAFVRSQAERRLTPDPLVILGERLRDSHPLPNWVDPTWVRPVAYMTGFRMSFRTDVIRACGGFDENLRDYASFEDIDASLSVARHGLLLGAEDARVYHWQHPFGRGGEFQRGYTNLLNRAYIVSKHTNPGDPVRKQLASFHRVRFAAYVANALRGGGTARLAGARAAVGPCAALASAGPDEAAGCYGAALERVRAA